MPTEYEVGDSTPAPETESQTPAEVESRTLCVVVHGIGNPVLGETIRDVARGITSGHDSVELIDEIHWIPGPDHVEDDGHSVRAFPVPVLRDRFGNFVLAEVHWSDLSRFPISLLGLVTGIFTVLFGLRYVAYQAVDGLAAPGAKVLRGFIRTATALLIGPIAATNLFLLFMTLVAVILDQKFPSVSHDETPAGDYAAGFGVLLALLSGALLIWQFWGNQVVRLIGASLCGIALAMLGIVGVGLAKSHYHLGVPREMWGVKFGEGIITYAGIATRFVDLLYMPVLLIVFAMLPVLGWMAATLRDQPKVTSAAMATSLLFVMTFSWSIAIPIAWEAIGRILPMSQDLQEDHGALNVISSPFSTRFPPAVVLLFVFGGVLVWWYRRRSRLVLRDDGARLIVNPWIQWGFVAAVSMATLLVVFDLLGISLEIVGTVIIAAIAAFLGILPSTISWAGPYLRLVFDVAYDVVNFFLFRFRDIDRRHDESPPPFPVRRAIEARLDATLNHFAKRMGRGGDPPWRLVVLSHSQGTVVAIGALNNPVTKVDQFDGIHLVTMGSPFSHIYQHYFRHHFPQLSDEHWQVIRRRLTSRGGEPSRWLNIFRVDDYVGRSIDDSVPGLVNNTPITPRGHLGYWFDRDVLQHIESSIGILRGFPSIDSDEDQKKLQQDVDTLQSFESGESH